ncbi:hypothetical protein ASE08_25820 [Rhizobacter sp. Root16D2]|nr:hypothetical protein ASC88_24040 [Rhizobacter sp. Root29]KQW08770.1 hypothetical protein ASC98_24940 [Rhizobacter sp. Root1238]KRB16340.1 hypothetical protein ASE08_25820 [Rhizobacter sp. Root16D2]
MMRNMATGIQPKDVWAACDALLLAGERPTIERVRRQLGRGSPNTVSPLLDDWYRHLGGRLKDPGAFGVPPDVPEPLMQAARHFWEVAQAEARRDVDQRVFEQRLREAMAAAVANVEAEKERAAIADAAAFEAAGRAVRLQAELARRDAALAEAHKRIDELLGSPDARRGT